MKNKKLKLGILILAAVTLFTATAFASAPVNEGYDTLKQIMMNQQDAKEYGIATVDGSFQISDNGKVIVEATGKVKGNHEVGEASGNVNIKFMDKAQELSFYKNKAAAYLVDETNSRYYQPVNMDKKINNRNEEYNRSDFAENHKMGSAGEALMDYFVGDLKSQFALSQNADGTRSIILDLDQNEIPTTINLLTAAAVENKGNSNDEDYKTRMTPAKKELLIEKLPFLKQFDGIENVMPRLETDVKLEGVYLKLSIDEKDHLKSFDVKFSITGKDANGASHDVTLSGSATVSDLNNTVVDSFNPDGKIIETIDMQEFEENH
jgi:hypothetical protein